MSYRAMSKNPTLVAATMAAAENNAVILPGY